MTPNHYLWILPDHFGWWFWSPLIFYGVYGLHKMYSLAEATTRLGRIIRVILTAAFLCMIGECIFSGIGPYAFHLLALGTCLTIKQLYEGCLAAGKIKKPTGRTVLGRLSERMMAKHH